MLERATACLDSGARLTLRRGSQAPRSRRSLHSTFWNHGAGDLDLPPWALSMFPLPPDQMPVRYDSTQKPARHAKGNVQPATTAPAHDGPLLDFLYPPQTLAWMSRTYTNNWERWEKRNVTRLPDGFVQASRGYSSHSGRQARAAVQNGQAGDVEWSSDGKRRRVGTNPSSDASVTVSGTQKTQHSEDFGTASGEHTVVSRLPPDTSTDDVDFAMSPGELAETPKSDAVASLRYLIRSPKNLSPNSEPNSEANTERAWSLYEKIDWASRADVAFQRGFMDWLVAQNNKLAAEKCMKVFKQIRTSHRTAETYRLAVHACSKLRNFRMALDIHFEGLKLKGFEDIGSNTFMLCAITERNWEAATVMHKHYFQKRAESVDTHSDLFTGIRDIDDLVGKARNCEKWFHTRSRKTKACYNLRSTIVKEAILQRTVNPQSKIRHANAEQLDKSGLQFLLKRFDGAAEVDASFYEDLLLSLLSVKSRFRYNDSSDSNDLYSDVHHVASFAYYRYRRLKGAQPSSRLLFRFLERLTEYEPTVRSFRLTVRHRSMTIERLVADWKHYHGRLSIDAICRLMSFYARSGLAEGLDRYLRYFLENYPQSTTELPWWTTIYVHARRADVSEAHHAIERMIARGVEPDLKCWNVLLHVHARADDLVGAISILSKIKRGTKFKPDAHTFGPVLEMYAKRGDIEGVEELSVMYDEISGSKRNTAIVASMINAHVNRGDVQSAQKTLRKALQDVESGEVVGSLTGCFNIILTANALRRDIDAAMRAYQWMKEENIPMDGNTYAALIQALTLYRRTDAAYKILRVVMAEQKIVPTAFHYGIVMAGYVDQGMYKAALEVHEAMQRRNIKPTFSTRVSYLKARALAEHQYSRYPENRLKDPAPLQDTINELENMLRGDGYAELAFKQSETGVGPSTLASAIPPAYFDFLIFIHGKRRCFDAVQMLYQRYLADVSKSKSDPTAPPIRLLTALMSAHWRAGEHAEVEQCWRLARSQADEIARLVPIPSLKASTGDDDSQPDLLSFEPAQVEEEQKEKSVVSTSIGKGASDRHLSLAWARRHILSRPLRYHMSSLADQSRITELIGEVSTVLSQGYILDNRTWNAFIEHLCRASPPLTLLAFTLTERYLIPSWPGWVRNTRWPGKKSAKVDSFEYIRTGYLHPGQLMPQYRTMVRLGAAFLALRQLEASGGRQAGQISLDKYVGDMRAVRRRAPRTLFAVQSMPSVPDRLQKELLRRE